MDGRRNKREIGVKGGVEDRWRKRRRLSRNATGSNYAMNSM